MKTERFYSGLFLTIIFLSFLISGCKKDPAIPEVEVQQFVFGITGGYGNEGYRAFYGIQNGKLYKVTENNDGKFVSVGKAGSSGEYLVALQLQNDLPNQLKIKPDTAFTCKNLLDQGFVTVKFNENGISKTSYIDDASCSDHPLEIQNYRKKVRDLINTFE